MESNFSPDNSSSIVTEKNDEISFSESILGYPLPDSYFEIAVLETNRASANSSCVKPLLLLNSFSFSLNSMAEPPFILTRNYLSSQNIRTIALYKQYSPALRITAPTMSVNQCTPATSLPITINVEKMIDITHTNLLSNRFVLLRFT